MISAVEFDTHTRHDLAGLFSRSWPRVCLDDRFATLDDSAHWGTVFTETNQTVGYLGGQITPTGLQSSLLIDPAALDQLSVAHELIQSALSWGSTHSTPVELWAPTETLDLLPQLSRFQDNRLVAVMEGPVFDVEPDLFAVDLTIDNLNDLIEVNRDAFASHPCQNTMNAPEVVNELASGRLDPTMVKLAYVDSRLAGFVWLTQHQLSQTAEIRVLAVSPRHQGQGLGRKLLVLGLYLLGQRGHRRAILYTESDNHEAIRLYESTGFRHVAYIASKILA